jgi:hypothetical protein
MVMPMEVPNLRGSACGRVEEQRATAHFNITLRRVTLIAAVFSVIVAVILARCCSERCSSALDLLRMKQPTRPIRSALAMWSAPWFRNLISTGTSDHPNYTATVAVRDTCQIETRR